MKRIGRRERMTWENIAYVAYAKFQVAHQDNIIHPVTVSYHPDHGGWIHDATKSRNAGFAPTFRNRFREDASPSKNRFTKKFKVPLTIREVVVAMEMGLKGLSGIEY